MNTMTLGVLERWAAHVRQDMKTSKRGVQAATRTCLAVVTIDDEPVEPPTSELEQASGTVDPYSKAWCREWASLRHPSKASRGTTTVELRCLCPWHPSTRATLYV